MTARWIHLFAILAIVAAIVPLVEGFSSIRSRAQQKHKVAKTTALQVGFAPQLHDESKYRYLLAKARECAFSDMASYQEAKEYLNGILELESGCVSGTIVDRSLCDNVDDVAMIVAHLREKIAKHESAVETSNAIGIVPLMAVLFFAFVIVSTLEHGKDAVPFTPQEWMWATKGGYLHTMIAHYVRNGGL